MISRAIVPPSGRIVSSRINHRSLQDVQLLRAEAVRCCQPVAVANRTRADALKSRDGKPAWQQAP